MGQTFSDAGHPSALPCSTPIEPSSENESRHARGRADNFTSLSCFTSRSGSGKKTRVSADASPDRTRPTADPETRPECERVPDDMPPSKKTYSVTKKESEDFDVDQLDDRNSNYGFSKRSFKRDDVDGAEGEAPSEPMQGCSRDVENATANKSSSIDRYMSAFFNQGLKSLNIEEDACKRSDESKCLFKSKNLKRTYKQIKGKSQRDNCFSKESKGNSKGGAKKKNPWSMKFCCSKTNKASSNAMGGSGGASASAAETESGCVCTSYKRVECGGESTERTESGSTPPFPRIQHNLTLGWASERARINSRNSSGWGTITGGSNIYTQSNRGNNECVNCEGSHCHVDLNALAEFGGLPINILPITVTRVGPGNAAAGSGSKENNLILLSLSTQNAPVIDLSRFSSDDHPLEDCDERARVIRAIEIAEGVEPPPGYNASHMQLVRPGELRALLFQQPLPATTTTTQSVPQHSRIHTQVDYIHCLVPDLRSITNCSFYWGKMDRYEAERLLDGKEEGTFLLRDSAQEEHLFSVSFRKYQRSLHARIEQFNHKFSFDSHDPGVFTSDTVTGLIEHYKDPSCVMFFEPMLTAPLSRTFTFPLQHLCRAVIVSCTTYDGINQLRLPNSLKTYLKEYHYRQRVRVKRFDESPYMPEENV